MRHNKVGILFLFIVVFFSCSDTNKITENCTLHDINGVKIYFNKNTPLDLEVDIKLNKLFDLSFSNTLFTDISDIIVDKDNNIYILDGKRSKIYKFDITGQFVMSFGGKGNGPGEFIRGISIFTHSDTVSVSDIRSKKIISYNLNGEFIYYKSFGVSKLPQNIISLHNGKYIGIVDDFKMNDNDMNLTRTLRLLNYNFMKEKIFNEYFDDFGVTKPINPFNENFYYCANDSLIYIAQNSSDKYSINIYNLYGNLISKIEKECIKIKVNQDEINDIKNSIDINVAGKKVTPKLDISYKNQISGLYVDNNKRLWVKTNEDNSKTIFDIFKDNIFIKRFELEYKNEDNFFIFNNFLMIILNDKLEVYEID